MTIKPSSSNETLIHLSDLNYWEAYREITRRASQGVVLEKNGLFLHAGGHPAPVIVNGVKRTHLNCKASDVLSEAVNFFQSRNHGFTVNVRMHADHDLEKLLIQENFSMVFEMPVMILNHRSPLSNLNESISIHKVNNEDQMRDFIDVLSESYEVFPGSEGLIRSVFSESNSISDSHIGAFVIYNDNIPVAASLVIVSYSVAFIGWVGTRPESRGKGYGKIATQAAINAGFDLGANMASLQASPMGEPLYRNMGFIEISKYREYMPPN